MSTNLTLYKIYIYIGCNGSDETESAPNVYAKNQLTKIIIKRLTI